MFVRVKGKSEVLQNIRIIAVVADTILVAIFVTDCASFQSTYIADCVARVIVLVTVAVDISCSTTQIACVITIIVERAFGGGVVIVFAAITTRITR